MVYCGWCKKNVKLEVSDGNTYCATCGRVFDTQLFSDEPTFVKNAAGQSQLSGNYVRSFRSAAGESRERTINRAYDDIRDMLIGLNMGESEYLVNEAVAYYTMALERNFTRGRRREYVEAACLYIACRIRNKPYLLIDFASYLVTNVYVLGAVFLQLCQILNLNEHEIVQKPIDPSLFIYKYTYNLCGKNKEVEETALHIIASMKRDWMQTGRKPSGLCGAAIYISALSHGLKYSKSDIVRVVHICEATLTKRLVEFENTESGSLTIEEFIEKAKELQESSATQYSKIASKDSASDDVLCAHKDRKCYACGLCEACYKELMDISGGFEGGSDPPAFQRAERERKMKEAEEHGEVPDDPYASRKDKLDSQGDSNTGVANKLGGLNEGEAGEPHVTEDATAGYVNESDNFSDIDDVEVDAYLHSEEEKQYKKIIWEEMNREYLEEQAAKEAAAAAAREAFAANFQNCPEDLQAAQEIAAAAAAAAAKSRKERQQKKAAETRNSAPPKTAAEATRQMLTKKRLSSKINFDVLEDMFDETVASEKPSKRRAELHSDNEELGVEKNIGKSEDACEEADLEPEHEHMDQGVTGETYDNDAYYQDPYETYDYDDEYGYDAYDDL